MNNVKNTIWQKRLPSVFGFFFVIIAVGTIGWLSRNAILFGTRAAIDETPKQVKISNVTDNSFTVSYLTDTTALGSITFGTTTNLTQIALDDRDQTKSTPTPATVHHITIKNLIPSTKYSFTITSGSKSFSQNNLPYTVTTGTKIGEIPSEKTFLEGKVTLDTGTPPTEALVYISSPTSQTLSGVLASDGSYKIDLSMLRDSRLTSLLPIDPNRVLQMEVIDATKKSTTSLLWNQTNAVPLITLSRNYDFVTSTLPVSPSPEASGSAEELPSFPIDGGIDTPTPQILTPKEDQTFKDAQPLFRGKAVPNETITITINSEQTITASVQADENGNWEYRPEEKLEPGAHTITIKTPDNNGLIKTITQSFVVYAEGSQFTEPSVSPSTTKTPSQTSAPTATTAPTATPTKTASGSASPTLSPTLTKTPTITQTVTKNPSVTKPPVPVTGNTSLVVIIGSTLAAISIGTLLFFFTIL